MKHKKPIKIVYLPVWLVETLGLRWIETRTSIDEALEPILTFTRDSEDYLKVQATNYALAAWLYGGSQLATKQVADSGHIDNLFSVNLDTTAEQTHTLLESIYGNHSPQMKVEGSDERWSIVCRSFEDVSIKEFANGDILILTDKEAATYYPRARMLEKLVCHMIKFLGYDQAIRTELFKTYLTSTYRDEDIKHALYHRVG